MFSAAETRLLAAGWLIAVGMTLVALLWRAYRQTRYSASQFPLYMLNLFLTRVLWRARVRGKIDLPPDQGAIIVCNHVGPIDPGIIALACDRPVHWMVAREYCHHPMTGWALGILGAIPVGRSGVDTAATKLAIRYASQGDVVGMFPEGRINDTGQFMLPGRPGAALVALKARVPVVPCFIAGSPNRLAGLGFLFQPARARLVVGKPIDLSAWHGRHDDRELLEELTLGFMAEIARLGGAPDYQPQLAGKRWKPKNAEL